MPEPAPAAAPEKTPGAQARALMRRAGQAALGTALARGAEARPYVSLVLVALDHDAGPVLLLSDLADHAKNLKADPRAALLFEGGGDAHDPLAEARATALGTVREIVDANVRARLKVRYLARHPSAHTYADFGDFRLYRMTLEAAHLVAGFGRVHWLTAERVRFDADACGPLAEAEAEIVAHMNQEHGEALRLIAGALSGLGEAGPGGPGPGAEPWRMVGIDPEGIDLRAGRRLARADFARPVRDAETARAELVRLAKQARRARAGD